MSANTSIEWCNHSWSPWRGCTKVSPGCAHCYAETLSKRNPAVLGQWGKGAPRVLASNWGEPVKWNRLFNKAEYFTKLQRQQSPNRPKVFPSLCDWLDEEVPIKWLVQFITLIHKTPNIDWLLLTKRPHLWRQRMKSAHSAAIFDAHDLMVRDWLEGRPPANVWVGTSVEDQLSADERIPELIGIPARIKFLSVEPLLGKIELEMALEAFQTFAQDLERNSAPIDWVIVGGESGQRSRPCNVAWVRSIVEQCNQSNVPCFVKQLGAFVVDRNDSGFEGDSGPLGWPMDTSTEDCVEPGIYQGKPVRIRTRHPKGGDPAEWPEDLRVRQFPEVKP